MDTKILAENAFSLIRFEEHRLRMLLSCINRLLEGRGILLVKHVRIHQQDTMSQHRIP